MLGQGSPHRFLARRLVGGRHFARSRRLVGLEVFQLQFQLFDLVVQLFRLAAELHAPQLGDLQFEVLDLDGARVQLLCHAGQLLIALSHQTLAGQQQCLQGIDIVGQVGGAEHASSLREHYDVYKADVGFQVRSGRRQSIPSRSIDSCACVNATEPLLACGQTKRPRSSRLASKHRPSPVHHSSLIRSPLRPRNTNTWPLNGSSSSAACTLAAKLSFP
jgi:hypothetical protein